MSSEFSLTWIHEITEVHFVQQCVKTIACHSLKKKKEKQVFHFFERQYKLVLEYSSIKRIYLYYVQY